MLRCRRLVLQQEGGHCLVPSGLGILGFLAAELRMAGLEGTVCASPWLSPMLGWLELNQVRWEGPSSRFRNPC